MTWNQEIAKWQWMDELLDGTKVLIRPIRKKDAKCEHEFLAHLSEEYQNYLFLDVVVKPLTPKIIKELTDLDYQYKMALIALISKNGKETEIGVSQYRVNQDGKSCQCAVTVSEEWQHRGLGTLLMQHLMEIARGRGIERMYAEDAAMCKQRHVLAICLGFVSRPDPEDPVAVTYECRLH